MGASVTLSSCWSSSELEPLERLRLNLERLRNSLERLLVRDGEEEVVAGAEVLLGLQRGRAIKKTIQEKGLCTVC